MTKKRVLPSLDQLQAALEPGADKQFFAQQVRQSAEYIAGQYPGHTVELRIPPLIVVQLISGPKHTRGTPPNVIETTPTTWLQLLTGALDYHEALNLGLLHASGQRSDQLAIILSTLRDN